MLRIIGPPRKKFNLFLAGKWFDRILKIVPKKSLQRGVISTIRARKSERPSAYTVAAA